MLCSLTRVQHEVSIGLHVYLGYVVGPCPAFLHVIEQVEHLHYPLLLLFASGLALIALGQLKGECSVHHGHQGTVAALMREDEAGPVGITAESVPLEADGRFPLADADVKDAVVGNPRFALAHGTADVQGLLYSAEVHAVQALSEV